MPAPPNLCPLCQQRALALNAESTLLTCASCGARADFDSVTRRVRYTAVPMRYSQFDGALRGRWLARPDVFTAVAAPSRPQPKKRGPKVVAAALVLCGGLGLMGLVLAMTRRLPAQPAAREGNTSIASVLVVASTQTQTADEPLATPTATPMQAPVNPTAESTPAVIGLTASPTNEAGAVSIEATPTSTNAQPVTVASPAVVAQAAQQPSASTALPTVDVRRIELVVTASPTPATVPSMILGTATARPVPTLAPQVSPVTPVPAQAPLPIGSDQSTPDAAITASPTAEATPPPTEVAPTETPIPTTAPTFMPTPTPAALTISTIAYVGGSTFEEYLELTNPTNQAMELPMQTWKMRISTTVGGTELRLGQYLSAVISLPAGQSCRIYTSKRAVSAGENSPCGFLTLGIVDDVDGIYPDKPGATVTLVNGDSQTVASFRY